MRALAPSPERAVDEIEELLAERRRAVRPQREDPLGERHGARPALTVGVVRPHQRVGAAGPMGRTGRRTVRMTVRSRGASAAASVDLPST